MFVNDFLVYEVTQNNLQENNDVTTLDKEKLFLGEQITEKDQTLSSSQKDDIVQSNKEFFEKYPSDYVKFLVENKLSQSTSSKKGSLP